MGLTDSTYWSLQLFTKARFISYGDRLNHVNTSQGQMMKLNLLGPEYYNPKLMWVMKVRRDGNMACEVYIMLTMVKYFDTWSWYGGKPPTGFIWYVFCWKFKTHLMEEWGHHSIPGHGQALSSILEGGLWPLSLTKSGGRQRNWTWSWAPWYERTTFLTSIWRGFSTSCSMNQEPRSGWSFALNACASP